MSDFESPRDVWNFEKNFSLAPQVWINHAIDLRYSAEALLLYDDECFHKLFTEKNQPRLPTFFSHNVERMLMGFSLENLLKALILMNPHNARRAFENDGRLSWSVPSHDLPKLAAAATISLTEEETHLLDTLSACATWAGRYPLPLNEQKLPRKRKPVPNRAMLSRRRKKEIEQTFLSGKPFLRSIDDQLHSNIGMQELKCYRDLFTRLLSEIRSREARAHRPAPN